MSAQISNILDEVEDLLKSKRFAVALQKLDSLNIRNISTEYLAYYRLLRCEIRLRLGEYNIEDDLNWVIAYYKDGGDNQHYAKARYLQGWLMSITGDSFNAREVLLESYLNYKRCNNLIWMARVLNRLALVQFQSGAVDDAIANLIKCIDIYRQLKNETIVLSIRHNLGIIYFMSGSLSESIESLGRLGQEMSTGSIVFRFQHALAYAMATALQGDIKRALQLIAKTTEFPDDYKREKAQYYEYLGWIYNLDEQYQKAVETLKTGIKLSLKIAPESALISQSKRLLADAYVGLGKFDLAETAAHEALVVAEKINERVEIAGCYRVFALIDRKKGNKQGCREWFKRACDIFTMIKSRYELAVTRYLAAKSGIYDEGERSAMLYLAREYFQSEDVHKFVEKIDRELNARPKVEIKNKKSDNHAPVFIAASPKMKKIVELAENVAQSDLNILLTGPTGAGKDQLAKYIHYCSGRKGEFVTVNSAAIPDSMVESELFGYRKGAFTGADGNRMGLILRSSGGTLYLNEIADATPECQAKLLEVIETKSVRPLGGDDRINVDLRIIAATNHDLEARMRENKFRLDLFHRLNVVPMALTPLSERLDDIPDLIEYFLGQHNVEIGHDGRRRAFGEFCRLMTRRNWPGNVRELMAYLDWMNVLAGGNIDLMFQHAREGALSESELLLKTLNETGWNRLKTARILGVSEGTVRNRIKQYNLQNDQDS